ncbi:hypothetical protein AX15_007133 [Amanita polypyramis BW_CC]|nr:hypothetical protein AX15_007133 [Amanita polypyramis BW_CC]
MPYWTCLKSAQDKTSKLMSSITNTFEKYAKQPKVNNKPTLWWTDDCNALKDQFIQYPNKANRMAYYKAIHQVKKKYFGQKIDEMCENNKPWEGVRWARDCPLSTIPHFANTKGESISTTKELWLILNNQFNLGNKKNTNINWDMINDLPPHATRSWHKISSFEIKEVIKTTMNNSALGYSNISWRHLKFLLREAEFILTITTLFNDILNEGKWPREFKIANTCYLIALGNFSQKY